MALDWKGDQILSKMRGAQRTGLQVTMGVAVVKAKQRVRVDTTRLQRSIEVLSLVPVRNGFAGRWGSEDPLVPYALKQEIGPAPGERSFGFTPYIRPSQQEEAPKLAGRIKAAYEGRPLPP